MRDWRIGREASTWVLRPVLPAGVAAEVRTVGCGPASAGPLAGVAAARVRQVHGARCRVVEEAGDAGEGDALATRRGGLALAVATADCLPVVLGDASGGISVAHAGWRGLAGGVIESAWEALAPRGAVWAVLGPAIGPCCFEVGEEVAERFPHAVARHRPRPHVDLAAEAGRRLRFLGADWVSAPGPCTRCHQHLLHSHRGSGGGAGRSWTYGAAPASSDS